MEYKWLKRIVLALKRIVLALKNRFKSHDASDQKVHKYVYRRGQNAETGNLAASKEKHEKLGYNHKMQTSALWIGRCGGTVSLIRDI